MALAGTHKLNKVWAELSTDSSSEREERSMAAGVFSVVVRDGFDGGLGVESLELASRLGK